ncbi:MAG: glycosyltransferase family 2 protein [Pseudomonadota bacterium]
MSGTITAIVPTYNRAGFLAEALAALASQTRPVTEILVWDDGSTDGTETVARTGPGPVRYFRSENGGKSRALNAALREARGDYIWICDDDDLALPDAAERLAGPLDADSTTGVSGASYRRFRTDSVTGGRIESGPGYWPDLGAGSILRHLLEDIFLFQNATLVRRSCYAAVGPFREDLARSIDYDMVVRLAARFPIAMREDVVFLQRKHDGVRGPAVARHAADLSDAVWKDADREIFAAFRAALPLALYEAMYDGPDLQAVRRAALLQRACIYARRTDWGAALEDFSAAAKICPETRLSRTEQAICRRAMAGKHGCDEALLPAVREDLRTLGNGSAAGAGVVRALLRGLVWRARAAIRGGEVVRIGQLARAGLALGPAARPRGAAPAMPEQAERRILPPTAYGLAA